jgi:hypothetical protein
VPTAGALLRTGDHARPRSPTDRRLPAEPAARPTRSTGRPGSRVRGEDALTRELPAPSPQTERSRSRPHLPGTELVDAIDE